MAENDSFVFYLEWIDYLEMLPPDKAMEILKAIVGLIRDEKTVQFTDPGQNMAYSFIANQVKRDKQMCIRDRDNVKPSAKNVDGSFYLENVLLFWRIRFIIRL